jgi:DNA-binding NarL/FixJ family response regulator
LTDNAQVTVAATNFVGRDAELARVCAFLSRVEEGPCAMVIRGEPGIGKTTLWRTAVELREAEPLSTLSTRCVEAELPLGFACLADLLQDVFPAAGEALADHERAVLASAIGVQAPRKEPRDAIVLPRAFLSLLRGLTVESPVLIAVDDLQWLDPASARVVSFAARRLREAPVGFLVTLRDGENDPLDLPETFGERVEEVRLERLSVGALARVVQMRLGVRIPGPVLARAHEASAGNPMFALELARTIADRQGQQLGPIPMPASLQDLVAERLHRQPREIRRLLAIMAAYGEPSRSLLSAVDPPAADSVDAAVDAEAITLGDDGVVRFAHPLLASAAYDDLAPAERREIHARLADALNDVEARARQLALSRSQPDGAVAELLDYAAARAHARGAPESAAELAREAVRLTPDGDARIDERRLAVADYLAAAGLTAETAAWAEGLLAAGLAGPIRARVLFLRGWAEPDLETRRRIHLEAVEHSGDDAPLRVRLLLALSSLHLMWDDPDIAASERAAREALATAEHAGDSQLLATALSIVADRADLAQHPHDALAERAIELEDAHGSLPGFTTARWRLAGGLLRRADLGGARALWEAELRNALGAGTLGQRFDALRGLFDVEVRAGNWDLAERHLEEAWSAGVVDLGDRLLEAELLRRRARLSALRGDADDARRLVAEGRGLAEAIHWAQGVTMNRWVLGFLELSLGEPARAWEALAETARPPVLLSLEGLEAAADGVEALVALDRVDDAGKLLITLRDVASRGHRWAVPAAERCAALFLIAGGDAEAAAAAAEKAADGFDAAGFQVDRARALFVAGETLRRAGKRRRASEKLEAANDIFSRLGAGLWAERAETELRRASPRPRRDAELTGAERRVAELVASGKTNHEVASQLYTTVNTVEKHLTRIYRKLGVRSRTELARGVADGSLILID